MTPGQPKRRPGTERRIRGNTNSISMRCADGAVEPSPADYDRAADAALDSGKAVLLSTGDGRCLCVIPDVIAVEGYANGGPSLSAGLRLVRADGRFCYLFRLPGVSR